MENILDNINYPDDLKKLNYNEKKELAKEIRSFLINIVSKNGGHLASNLGVVELTIGIHSVFNTPKDKIVWDVGHQTYVHKIFTGRKNEMKTLRKLNGVSGFPKTTESEYDCFDTGHSSTSISAALGIARARDILNQDYKVVAVIGDGALTGGLAQEALNDAGASGSNIIIILNDNEMSISKNVGGVSLLLAKMRTRKSYTKTNETMKNGIEKIPKVGDKIVKGITKIKNGVKQLFISEMFFEDIGFTYLGPVDGNNIEDVEEILKQSQKCKGPVLVHVVTKKGKGYLPSENDPSKFHGTAPFDIKTGESLCKSCVDYSSVLGKKLVNLAEKDNRIVAITAAMTYGTGLAEFSKKFHSRFFDVGIAEEHAVCMAAGMASNGLIPFVPIYSSFYQRAYDQVIHDVCMQNLHVIMCGDRAGIVGNDGETHQGLFDMSMFSIIPNMTIIAPKDFEDFNNILDFAVNFNSPIFIRYPRGGEGKVKFNNHTKIELGKSELIKTGNDLTIIAIGKMVSRAVEVANILKNNGINAEIINARFIKPFDEKNIITSISRSKNVVTIEDGILKGGLSSIVNELISKNNMENVSIMNFGYGDKFIKQGSIDEIEKLNGLDCENIANNILINIKK